MADTRRCCARHLPRAPAIRHANAQKWRGPLVALAGVRVVLPTGRGGGAVPAASPSSWFNSGYCVSCGSLATCTPGVERTLSKRWSRSWALITRITSPMPGRAWTSGGSGSRGRGVFEQSDDAHERIVRPEQRQPHLALRAGRILRAARTNDQLVVDELEAECVTVERQRPERARHGTSAPRCRRARRPGSTPASVASRASDV